MALTADDKQWIKGAITDGIVDALNEIVLPRFAEHDRRFDAMGAQLDSIETRLDRMESDISQIKSRLGVLESDMKDVKEQLGTHDWQIEAMASDIKELYNAIFKEPSPILVSKAFEKLSDKDKLSVMNQQILKMAKKLNIELQR